MRVVNVPYVITCNSFINTPSNSLHYCCYGKGKVEQVFIKILHP